MTARRRTIGENLGGFYGAELKISLQTQEKPSSMFNVPTIRVSHEYHFMKENEERLVVFDYY